MKYNINKIMLVGFVPISFGLLLSFQDFKPSVEELEQVIVENIDSVEVCPPESGITKYRYLNWNDFVETTIWVESRGQDSAYNHQEKAVGVLQIRPIMVREVNRVLRKHKSDLRFTLDDRWNRQKSIDMFDIMAEEVYCCEDMSFKEFCEIVARKWNGGGRGHKKKATLEYWYRIENKMNEINLEL